MCRLLRHNRNNSLGNRELLRISSKRLIRSQKALPPPPSTVGMHRSDDWDFVAIRFILFR